MLRLIDLFDCCCQDDERKRLPSSVGMSDHHEMVRLFSLPNDSGPEHIMTGDEYLMPRTNGVMPATAADNQPPAVSVTCLLLY